ncbi:MAG TPA: lysylphosphatidylglycerol synthase transmembrane domain-containing protein [Ohtaekwangia sp.]|nr:lysylphosphatidylglycerol synthase transmembrane domain-containing protein [Ohtaekwangia sp.]
MSSGVKTFLQYLFIFSLTILLIWVSLRGLQGENKWEYLKGAWTNADKGWLLLMAAVAIASHVVRALRWRMLMEPAGHHSKLSHSFYSLMVGYLVNLVVPRGGEVSRCYNLYKLNQTPVEVSFGTVVLERIVDVICLLVLIVISFAVEYKKLIDFIETLPFGEATGGSKSGIIAIVIGAILLVLLVAFLIIRRNEKIKQFIRKTWNGFKEGLLSVFKLEQKKLFIFYSVLIWALYFLMSYTVIMAFEATSVLGWSAVLSLFAIGAIAMAAPLPGGTGSYHVLVPQSLVFLYHVSSADAVAFTFIFHGWQTLIMILGGAISLILTSIIIRRKKKALNS